MSNPWTIAKVQAALGETAYLLLAVVDQLETIYKAIPKPPDLADRQEHRKPYDRATDILGTIEGVLDDDLRPAIRRLQESAQITDEELAEDFRRRKAFWRPSGRKEPYA